VHPTQIEQTVDLPDQMIGWNHLLHPTESRIASRPARWQLMGRDMKEAANEKLGERHDVRVSRETLRCWMRKAGIWLPRAERKRIQQPRHRREHVGELIQIDGSDHRWFEDRAAPCTLLVFIDDATSRLMELRFVPSESTFAYFETLKSYLQDDGKPVAFYSDKHSLAICLVGNRWQQPPIWPNWSTKSSCLCASRLGLAMRFRESRHSHEILNAGNGRWRLF
jgi:hypothetical protein